MTSIEKSPEAIVRAMLALCLVLPESKPLAVIVNGYAPASDTIVVVIFSVALAPPALGVSTVGLNDANVELGRPLRPSATEEL